MLLYLSSALRSEAPSVHVIALVREAKLNCAIMYRNTILKVDRIWQIFPLIPLPVITEATEAYY
jgi:hypothetical protein